MKLYVPAGIARVPHLIEPLDLHDTDSMTSAVLLLSQQLIHLCSLMLFASFLLRLTLHTGHVAVRLLGA